jgi:hypothetical protein
MKFLLLSFLLFFTAPPYLPAEENALPGPNAGGESLSEQLSGDEELARLGEVWDKARKEYREALKQKREEVLRRIEDMEEAVQAEEVEEKRRDGVEALRKLFTELDELDDGIREINAGDVVKFSNGRDKFVKLITGQK